MTSKDTDKSTCSPVSAASASDSEWQAGLTIDLFSQADSPASPGVSPGSSEAQKMTVTSGQKWQDLLKVCGLDGCLAKTFRALLENRWASTECFLTWNVSATPQGRQVFRLVPSMPLTGAPESGLWPTPQEHDKHKGDPKRVGRFGTKHGGRNLNEEAALWPTPRAITGGPESTERKQELGRTQSGGGDLQSAAKMWATPSSRDWKDTPGMAPTGVNPDGSTRNREDQLPRQVSGQTTPSSEGGALNPTFVCWLMGYPSEWINCAPSAMPSSRKSSLKSPAQ